MLRTDANLLLPAEPPQAPEADEVQVRYDAYTLRSGALLLVPHRDGVVGVITRADVAPAEASP